MKTTNQQPTTVGTSPKWKQPMISTGCVLLASLLMSVNIKSFVRAGNLIPGGFTGLSLLLQRTAETFFGISLPYSVINIALNAIPAIIGFRMIGKKFTSYTVLMIVLNSFLVDLIPVTPITYDPLLVSVFGGILNGTAISIALFGKASSGGTDFIAVYLSSRLHKPSWNFVFGINVVILTTAGFLFGFELRCIPSFSSSFPHRRSTHFTEKIKKQPCSLSPVTEQCWSRRLWNVPGMESHILPFRAAI